MTPPTPLTISDEARFLAENINTKVDRWIKPFMPVAEVEEICQCYINQATAKLEEENKTLRHQIGTDFMAGIVIEKDQVIAKLEERVRELEHCLRQVFYWRLPLGNKIEEIIDEKDNQLWRRIYVLLENKTTWQELQQEDL